MDPFILMLLLMKKLEYRELLMYMVLDYVDEFASWDTLYNQSLMWEVE